jgi:hypothetical protein
MALSPECSRPGQSPRLQRRRWSLAAGRPHSLWYLGGSPGAGSGPSVTTAGGVALSSSSTYANDIAGQLPHQDPGGNAYLGRLTGMATQAGLLMLCDRLLHGGAISDGTQISVTSTSSQTINTTTLPARDANGATAGAGVMVGCEVTAAMGAGTPSSLTVGYTNSAGTTSKTATNFDTVVASSAIGAFYRMGLVAGDLGVQQITSWTNGSTWTSGTITLVMYRVLAALELPGAFIPNAIDALTAGFPQLFNGVVPFLIFVPNTTTASIITGTYAGTHG